MKIFKFFGYLAFLSLLASCSAKQEGTDAEVSEAREVGEVASSATQFEIQPEASTVGWIGSKPTGKHHGTIPISEGTLNVADGTIAGGMITLNVAEIQNEDLAGDTESQGKLLGHLKSDAFFDAQNYPVATFEITSVAPYTAEDSVEVKEEYPTEYAPATADKYMVESPTHKISGNLTMRGKTLNVTFPASVNITKDAVTAKAKFNIDRTDWGLSYGDEADAVDKAKDKFIYNTVNVSLDITAKPGDETAAM